MRSLLLAASQNRWLANHATRYSFVRGTVSGYAGETLDDALGAAEALRSKKIGTGLHAPGETTFKDRAEAQQVAEHYQEVLERIRARGLQAEISVKLTQLGLDSHHRIFVSAI